MTIYERVCFSDGSRRRVVFLRVTRDSDSLPIGVEVDKQGDEISGADFDERTRVISKDLIISRSMYAVDPYYGELVLVAKLRK